MKKGTRGRKSWGEPLILKRFRVDLTTRCKSTSARRRCRGNFLKRCCGSDGAGVFRLHRVIGLAADSVPLKMTVQWIASILSIAESFGSASLGLRGLFFAILWWGGSIERMEETR